MSLGPMYKQHEELSVPVPQKFQNDEKPLEMPNDSRFQVPFRPIGQWIFAFNAIQLIAFILLFCVCLQASAALLSVQAGVVMRVVDGDTVWVQTSPSQPLLKVRIQGIDAPEICQTGGLQAQEALKNRVLASSTGKARTWAAGWWPMATRGCTVFTTKRCRTPLTLPKRRRSGVGCSVKQLKNPGCFASVMAVVIKTDRRPTKKAAASDFGARIA